MAGKFIEVVGAALKSMNDGLAFSCRKIWGCEYELVDPVDISRLRLRDGGEGETAEKGKRELGTHSWLLKCQTAEDWTFRPENWGNWRLVHWEITWRLIAMSLIISM